MKGEGNDRLPEGCGGWGGGDGEMEATGEAAAGKAAAVRKRAALAQGRHFFLQSQLQSIYCSTSLGAWD